MTPLPPFLEASRQGGSSALITVKEISRVSREHSHRFDKYPSRSKPIAPLLHEVFTCRRIWIAQTESAGSSPQPRVCKERGRQFCWWPLLIATRCRIIGGIAAAPCTVDSMTPGSTGIARGGAAENLCRRTPDQPHSQSSFMNFACAIIAASRVLWLLSMRPGDSAHVPTSSGTAATCPPCARPSIRFWHAASF